MTPTLRPYQQAGVHRCKTCGEEKPLCAFPKVKTHCRPCAAEITRRWREKNPGRNAAASKDWARRNPEKKRDDYKAWRIKNAEKLRAKKAAYYQATKERARQRKNQYQRGYEKRRRETDFIYSLNERMSRAIRGCLAGCESKQGRRWQKLVGYTLEELRAHLERQFLPGMNWCNRKDWHIDHIVPLADFKITSAGCAEFRAAWALGNLRPLWSSQNIAKRHARVFLV